MNHRNTFENFVVDESNKVVFDICSAVAKEPGKEFSNPLYLYSRSGLGKTHLLCAIADRIRRDRPEMNVISVTAEEYTNEIISAIQKNKVEELRERYRRTDVLIIEDIQGIVGRERTQMEFFNTFNHLYETGKQIILSADRAPNDYVMPEGFTSMDERIRSRLAWGVAIEIQSYDYEARKAILKRKAELVEMDDVPDSVFRFIAEHVTTNVRELEGALNLIKAYSQVFKEPVNDVMARTILKDMVSKKGKQEP